MELESQAFNLGRENGEADVGRVVSLAGVGSGNFGGPVGENAGSCCEEAVLDGQLKFGG